jgi:hypothetical protein
MLIFYVAVTKIRNRGILPGKEGGIFHGVGGGQGKAESAESESEIFSFFLSFFSGEDGLNPRK